eukprot:g67106.t1
MDASLGGSQSQQVVRGEPNCHAESFNRVEVEAIDSLIYRGRKEQLWKPQRARGVFGGQVIAQALHAPEFRANSLHAYFLNKGNEKHDIIYNVEKLRDGRTFHTRFIKAVQKGHIVFVMLASFQRPAP